jgi:hypothetical protein
MKVLLEIFVINIATPPNGFHLFTYCKLRANFKTLKNQDFSKGNLLENAQILTMGA